MQTKPTIQGSKTSPKGKLKGLTKLINIQAIPPIKKVTTAKTRYKVVFLEESNLLKNENSIPGYIIELKGNHAHF